MYLPFYPFLYLWAAHSIVQTHSQNLYKNAADYCPIDPNLFSEFAVSHYEEMFCDLLRFCREHLLVLHWGIGVLETLRLGPIHKTNWKAQCAAYCEQDASWFFGGEIPIQSSGCLAGDRCSLQVTTTISVTST